MNINEAGGSAVMNINEAEINIHEPQRPDLVLHINKKR